MRKYRNFWYIMLWSSKPNDYGRHEYHNKNRAVTGLSLN